MAHPLCVDPEVQPYTDLLYRAIRARGVTLERYRTLGALRSPPDAIHIHWPEHVLNEAGLRKYVRATLRLAVLAQARGRGSRLVYTAHNVAPHDLPPTRFARWYMRTFDRMVDSVLLLSEAGAEELFAARPLLSAAERIHVRHGHFRDVYRRYTRDAARRVLGADPDRPLVAFTGEVRSYKGVLDLLDACKEEDVKVVVAGWCTDDDLRREIEQHAVGDDRVTLLLRRLSSEELAIVVAAADLVALPYRRVLNSGSALLALSLDRPVLVPDTPTFRELRAEVGSEWVHLFDSTRIRGADLRKALAGPIQGEVDLSGHEWDRIAVETIRAYETRRSAL